MKVLLICPYLDDPTIKRNDFLPSAALLSLAAVLRKEGHQPVLLDLNSKEPISKQNPPVTAMTVSSRRSGRKTPAW
jgi:hypothetical protein